MRSSRRDVSLTSGVTLSTMCSVNWSPVNRRKLLSILAVCIVLVASCAPRDGDDIGSPIFNGTTPNGVVVEPPIPTLPAPTISAIRVPADAFTIQEAVDRAQPGDLILVDPGVYTEEVLISTEDLVIRGRNRNDVFIDGIHALTTGIQVNANGVAIENLTVRNYLGDAIAVGSPVLADQIDSFRALHVTTSNTAQNGIALRNVINAELRQGWHSGHGESGVLVDSCVQCNTLVTSTLAEFSARGFSVIGAQEAVSITAVTARNNRAGIVIEDSETAPTTGATVAASIVQSNGFSQSPVRNPVFDTSFGTGVHVGGTQRTLITANRITGNTSAAILLSQNVNQTSGNPVGAMVNGNVILDNRDFDIVLAYRDDAGDPDLCVSNNGQAAIAPPGALEAASCGTDTPAPNFQFPTGEHTSIEYQNGPVPPTIDGMGDADSAPPIPAGPVILPDPATATVPDA